MPADVRVGHATVSQPPVVVLEASFLFMGVCVTYVTLSLLLMARVSLYVILSLLLMGARVINLCRYG